MSEENPTPADAAGKPPRKLPRTEHMQLPKPQKPEKPYPEFPLFPHAAGVWAKKIRGKLHYFGPWSDPDGALENYLKQADDLHAGRTPRPSDTGAATVKGVVNAFLNSKQEKVESGEMAPRTWRDYKAACDAVVKQFGKGRLVEDLRPDDFARLRAALAKRLGPASLGVVMTIIKMIFAHAYNAELLDRPVRYGNAFDRPSKKTLRLHRAAQGVKLFSVAEVRRMLDAAGQPLRSMLLLGINAGMGNADIARLPFLALDLDGGWLNFPRGKTGINRRCPLWPETVQALREAIAARPAPRDPEFAGLVYITERGDTWFRDVGSSPLNRAVAKLLRRLGINGRKGLGFYTLRHVFRTVADEAHDQPACDHLMGHHDPSMADHYRERISDARLRTVADHVRQWLFSTPEAKVESSNG
jgi:integrase